jgi:hypothetical protein
MPSCGRRKNLTAKKRCASAKGGSSYMDGALLGRRFWMPLAMPQKMRSAATIAVLIPSIRLCSA